MVFNFGLYFDFTPKETPEFDRNKMLFAIVGNRKDERLVKKEYEKCYKTLITLENTFIEEVFLIEHIDVEHITYNNLYKHYLTHWKNECDSLSKRLKCIKINKKYFSDCYKPLES